MEPLVSRMMLSVTALWAAGELKVTGDDLDNVITISRTAGGTILVNNGAIPIVAGPATIANTTHLHLVGAGGNDNIALDETNGAIPPAALFGGTGNDSLVGGSGIDFADGEAGNDTVSLGAGDDEFQWNPGDGSDVVDGGAGRDTMYFNGSDVAESFELSDNGNHARLTRDIGGVAMDLNGLEEINLNTFGGADTITIDDQSTTGLNTLNVDLDSAAGTGFGDNQADTIIANGTDGNDVGQIGSIGTRIDATISAIPFVHITGEDGLDALTVNTLGGNDTLDASDLAATNASQLIKLTIDGGTGNDTITGSQGFDTFTWNAGDGNDSIDGGDGEDTMIVNGSDAAERFGISGDGSRVAATRDLDGSTIDFGNVETVTVNPLGGADTVTVNNLSGTPVTEVDVNLSGIVGSTTGDGQADSVIVNGTGAGEVLPVIGHNGVIALDGGNPGVTELPYFTVIRAVEASDSLRVNGNGGDDTINADEVETPVRLTIDGGAGNDAITGSRGDDQVIGGPGNDLAFLADGDDSFTWNAGDGFDTVEGMAGTNTLNFNGSGLGENIVVSPNGAQVRVTDDIGNVAIDLDGIEQLSVNALGGSDFVTVGDLTGTAVTNVKIRNIMDGQIDSFTLTGSDNADTISIVGDAFNGIHITGLAAELDVIGAFGVPDLLTVNAEGGADTVDASGVEANAVILAPNGGDGNDTLTSSQGDNVIYGGAGTDTINITGSAAANLSTLLPSGGDDTVNVNTGGVGFAELEVEDTQRIGALNIGSGAVTLEPGSDIVLTATALNITSTGQLDLADNDLIVDYTGISPINALRSMLATGRHGGAWDGPGIVSRLGDPSHLGVGYGEASLVAPGGTFAGQPVDGTAVVLRLSFLGDANLDGNVDTLDFNSLAANFGHTGRIWTQSDFNYDAVVDTLDFNALAANFGQSGALVRPGLAPPAAPASPFSSRMRIMAQSPLDLRNKNDEL